MKPSVESGENGLLSCGEFHGRIKGDAFELLVCSGYDGEVWERVLTKKDLSDLAALLDAAFRELHRRSCLEILSYARRVIPGAVDPKPPFWHKCGATVPEGQGYCHVCQEVCPQCWQAVDRDYWNRENGMCEGCV